MRQHSARPAGLHRRQELSFDGEIGNHAIDAAMLRKQTTVGDARRDGVRRQTASAQIGHVEHAPLLRREQSAANVGFA